MHILTHHSPKPRPAQNSGLSRRGFLMSAGATAGITLSYGLFPASAKALASSGMISPSIFADIHPSGRITFHVTKSEMGQHVGTALAQIMVEEMGGDWSQVELKYVGFEPKYGLHVTGGSWSINWSFDMLARAGAASRIALIEAAAKMLGGSPADYTVKDSVISGNGTSITFGELAAAGVELRSFDEAELAELTLKPKSDYTLVGQAVDALDIPDKTRGAADYGIDAKIDGMVYATPAIAPVRYGAKVLRVDDSAAKEYEGYQRYVIVDDPLGTQTGWVMAVADSYWTAKLAAEALQIEYDAGPSANVSLSDIHAESARLIAEGTNGRLVVNDGDAQGALKAADIRHKATYTSSLNIHAPLEPMNATVEIKDGVYHIHTGNQFQTLAVGLVEALGIKPEQIKFHQYLLGGGFGRRLEGDYVVLACLTAREVGKPVKMIYSREADMMFDFSRPAATVEMEAGASAERIESWSSKSASSWPTARLAPAFLAPDLSDDEDAKYDTFAVNGADHWYTIPNQKVVLHLNELAQTVTPSGQLRSVGPGWQCFAVESFVDEMAAKMGADPLQLRLDMLDAAGKNAGDGATKNGPLRLAETLRLVADKSGYGSALPANTAIGIAAVPSQERQFATWTSCAARVSVDPSDGSFKVEKLTLAMDCGTVVNPAGVRAQISGSSLWGLSLATLEEAEFENGSFVAQNFDTYTPLRSEDVPQIDIHLIDTDFYPTGAGEPATTVVGPAVANAIFAAVGARVRSLPITPEKVLAALG